MTYVVCEPCINCKYTACVAVCPVDAFREGPNFLAIDPDDCIDCGLCVPECPVDAIRPEEDVAPDQQEFKRLNKSLSAKWKVIARQQMEMPDAGYWATVKHKRRLLVVPSEHQPPLPTDAKT